MPISNAVYTQEIDLTAAHTNLEITIGTFSWVQFFCDGGVNGVKVAVGSQNTNVINLNEFRTIPVVEGQKVYVTNDVRSGRSRLLMVFSRSNPLESYQGGDPVNNAELAARLGSIHTFDRRGEVIFADDFESGLGKWIKYNAALTTEIAFNGSLCCKLTVPSAGGTTAIQRRLPFQNIGRLGVEFSLAVDSLTLGTHDVYFELWDGTNFLSSVFGYDAVNDVYRYLNSSGVLTTITGATGKILAISTTSDFVFHRIKFVVDFNTKKYVRGIINNEAFDLSSLPIYSIASATRPSLTTYLSVAGNSRVAWVGHCIVTQNEP